MSKISIECNVTEFSVYPNEEYEKVLFYLDNKSIVISFLDENDNVLTQSEIEKKDAINLANVILLNYAG